MIMANFLTKGLASIMPILLRTAGSRCEHIIQTFRSLVTDGLLECISEHRLIDVATLICPLLAQTDRQFIHWYSHNYCFFTWRYQPILCNVFYFNKNRVVFQWIQQIIWQERQWPHKIVFVFWWWDITYNFY